MTYIIMSVAVFILGLIAVYAYFIIKKEFGLSSYEEHAKKKVDVHLRHVINSSEEVLNEAAARMKQLLSQTSHFNRDIELQAKMVFGEFKDHYVANLNSELAKAEKQYEEEFYRSTKELRGVLDSRFKEQMSKSDDLVAAFTKTQFASVTKEIEEYKKAQEEKSARKLEAIFSKVLEDVVGKSLNREDQKKLIWSSLESISKESFSGK